MYILCHIWITKDRTIYLLTEKDASLFRSVYREQLRQQFDGKLVIGQTFRFPCISIYPAPEFRPDSGGVCCGTGIATMQFQNLMRTIVGSAHKCDMLASGRILLPKQLREFNSIEKDAVLIGMGTRFELWDHNEFNSHNSGINSGTDEEYQEILEKIDNLIISGPINEAPDFNPRRPQCGDAAGR